MLKVLGETYYVDLDKIETYLDMSDTETLESSASTDTKINIIKFEMVKMMLDVIFSENEDIMDDKLGIKSNTNGTTIPFRIAFNSLLNKKLINHY